MSTIYVAIDRITSSSSDKSILSSFCEKVKAAGHNVTNCGRGPNQIQSTMGSKSCDIMVQIAGGQCPGTFADFSWGTRPGGYYHASKFCIPMCTGSWSHYDTHDPKKYKLPAQAWDDNFSGGLDKSHIVGRTWQQISNDKTNFPRCLGFVEGKNADELAKGFIALLNGGSSSTGSGDGGKQGGGGSVLDLIKQVCSDWDPLGPEIGLNGDTLTVKRTNPKTATPLTTKQIVRNSVTWNDYDSNTPNSFGGVKDKYLVDRFGEIPLEIEVEDSNKAQVLQVNQRGHNHSIDLKVIMNPDYVAGRWVNLTIPELGISSRPYYISKNAYQEERQMSLTLESAPPSIYVEVSEETSEEEVAETEETTEEET
jgi:hypothetical protein